MVNLLFTFGSQVVPLMISSLSIYLSKHNICFNIGSNLYPSFLF